MAWRRASGRSGVLTRPAGSRATGGPAGAASLPSAGAIGPRPGGVPRGRAVLGGLLIAAAAVVVFAAGLASTRGGGGRYVVATQPMAAGTIIGPGDTATATFRLPGPARAQAFGSPDVVVGRALAVAVSPGELLQASMLAPPSGTAAVRPVSIAVDSTSLAGLAAGDQVDVLATAPAAGSDTGTPSGSVPGATGATGGPASGTVQLVLRGAALLAVARSGSSVVPASSSQTVVTLGVTSLGEAETVVAASHSETISLVQAEPSDGSGPGPGPGG